MKHLLHITFMSVLTCCILSCRTNNSIASSLNKNTEITDTAASQSDKAYKLVYSDSLKQSGCEFPYIRQMSDVLLDNDVKQQLINYLNSDRHIIENNVLMSPYIPVLELEFMDSSSTYNIIVSFSDHSWTVSRNGETLYNNIYTCDQLIDSIYNKLK